MTIFLLLGCAGMAMAVIWLALVTLRTSLRPARDTLDFDFNLFLVWACIGLVGLLLFLVTHDPAATCENSLTSRNLCW